MKNLTAKLLLAMFVLSGAAAFASAKTDSVMESLTNLAAGGYG